MSSSANDSRPSYSAEVTEEITQTESTKLNTEPSVSQQESNTQSSSISNYTEFTLVRLISQSDIDFLKNEENLLKVAKLANLSLSEGEKKEFVKQLPETVEYIEQLNDVLTKGIEPIYSITGLSNIFRNIDEIEPSLTQQEALQNARSTENGQFKVDSVFGGNLDEIYLDKIIIAPIVHKKLPLAIDINLDIKGLSRLTIKQAVEGLKEKKFTSEELTRACLEKINNVEEKLNTFVTICAEEALEQAKKADQDRANGLDLPLLGIPFAIKDNFCTKGIITTASSYVLDNFVPPYDATVVKKLKDAGAIIIGKTNMDAWAHGSSTETSDYGVTKNPWDLERVPGGSSGGAAAAISADEVIGSIGSETAGSIRQPASWCGVVGLKPTYGRVSRYGVIAMASSLDCPGPLTKTVEDAALVLNVLAGEDKYDATTSHRKVEDYTKNLAKSIKGLKVGIAGDYLDSSEPEVREVVKKALLELEKMGAEIIPQKLFDPMKAIAVYTIQQRSEVSSNLSRHDGIRYGYNRSAFGTEAKRRVILGTYTLSAGYYDAFYIKAAQIRRVILNDFNKVFKTVDIVVGPTVPVPALRVGASVGQTMFGEKMDKLLEPSAIAGLPGINVPCGFTKEGLPVGLQIIGQQFSESLILNVAYQYERVTNWHKEKPKL